ncbi:hypothetical protein ACG2F4_08400 [Halalkalibaculum sp. DA3122]|uniref:DUF7305 domain-containing protein n=1 Tax=unclassified Halalkalibaculum TaxID=2964617 RepID=UPI00375505B1
MGGDYVSIAGNAEAHTRAFYAPNAEVELKGSATVRGAIVARQFSAVGNSRVYFSKAFDSELPELESQQNEHKISYWK